MGLLGGTPGANAAARTKAKAKAKGVPFAAGRRRDASKHAFKTIYKRAVRSQDRGAGMVEAAFGADERAAPAAVDLEQELSDFIDEDEGLLIVSGGIMGSTQFLRSRATAAATLGSKTNAVGWFASSVVSIVSCHAGNIVLFRRAKFVCFCKFAQATCRLIKRRRLA